MSESTRTNEDQEIIEMSATGMNQPVVFDVTKAGIQMLAEEYKNFPTDLAIKENYNIVKAGVSKTRRLRSKVENRRKELKKDALEYGKKVDGIAKELKESLLEIETPMKEAKTEQDNKEEIAKREAAAAEEKRVDTIHESIAGVATLVSGNISATSKEIHDILEGLKKEDASTWADEFEEKAITVIAETITGLESLMEMKKTTEAAEELAEKTAKENAEKEAAEKKAHEDEVARMQAENEKIAAANRVEREKLDEEKRALQAEKEAAAKVIADQEQKIKDQEEAAMIAEAKIEQDKKDEEIRIIKEKREAEKAEEIKLELERQAQIKNDKRNESIAETVEALNVIINDNKNVAEVIINQIIGEQFPHLQWVD